MKIRNGFVSNSSSSSFVIAGCRLDKDIFMEEFNVTEEQIEEAMDNYEYDNLVEGFDVDYDSEAETFYVGEIIVGNANFYGGESIPFANIEKAMRSEQVKKLKEMGFVVEIVIIEKEC